MPLTTYLRTLAAPAVELPPEDGPVLILSMRRISDLVGYCALYEFEDLVSDFTGSGIATVTNTSGIDLLRKLHKVARSVTGRAAVTDVFGSLRAANNSPGSVSLRGRHELFFPVFNHIFEVFALRALRDWRKQCRVAACYLGEAWTSQLPRYLVEQLRDFDHIFVGVQGAVEGIAKLSGRPCSYLPRAVDALRFCPLPNPPERSIDVCGIGRRAEATHEALLELAARDRSFYFYDTIRTRAPGVSSISYGVTDPVEHRLLLANLLKRSRYFTASRAFADRPALTGGQEEISGRFYEGAAAGTVMLGEPPNTEEFRRQFSWDGAVISIPFSAPRIGDAIAELDRDPARVARIRRDGIVNSLLRHDWVYRFRTILETLHLPLPAAVLAREQQLAALAAQIDAQPLRWEARPVTHLRGI